MGSPGSRSLTLDAGALIAFDRGDGRLRSVVRLAVEAGIEIAIPAGALAQAWRDGRRQANLSRLVGDPRLRVEDLTRMRAKAAGALCGRAGTTDVVDASIVICARRQANAVVLTSDPQDLLRLDPTLRIELV